MPARDGYVVPSVQGSQPWETVADLIGLEELHDPRFASGAGRIAHGEELKALLVEGLAQWDRLPLFLAVGGAAAGVRHGAGRGRFGGLPALGSAGILPGS